MNRIVNRRIRHAAGVASTATVGVIAVLSLAACSSSSYAPTSGKVAAGPSTSASHGSAGSSGAVVKVANSSLGRIVVAGNGMTAYVFTVDKRGSGKSSCTGACLSSWPPITAGSAKITAHGVTGKLATIAGPGGRRQVTLNGYPLYTYAGDTAPGDVNGQGVKGSWFVATPSGTMIRSSQGGGSNGGY